MVGTVFSQVNPKAGAIFRLLTTRAGLTGELIPGGVLQNPLPISQTNRAIGAAIVAANSALEEVTAPPEEAYITSPMTGERIPNPKFEETEGKPQPKLGYEAQFYSLQALIGSLGGCSSALVSGTTSLQGHTDRIVNNLIDLCGLAQAYTQTIQKLGLGTPVHQRANTSAMKQVPNMSNASNEVNLGGMSGSGQGFEPGFQQITMPEVLAQYSNVDAPEFTDIVTGSQNYGEEFADLEEQMDDLQEVDDYRMITKLDALLTKNGVPAGILPPESLLAEVNPAAHCETLFRSIIPTTFGGEGHPILEEVQRATNFMNVDLMDVEAVRNIQNTIDAQTAAMRALVARERCIWGEDMLRPPTFPSGRVLQVIFQVSRCESIVGMSTDKDVQGILFSCITPLSLEVLRTK